MSVYVRVCVSGGGTPATVPMWRAEDNYGKFVFSLPMCVPGVELRLSILAAPPLVCGTTSPAHDSNLYSFLFRRHSDISLLF